MSKRAADFQLTSENYDLEEKKLCGLSSKEGYKGEEAVGNVLENKEEISARKIVRIRKRHDDFGVGSKLTPETVISSESIPTTSTFGKDLKDEKSGINDNIDGCLDEKKSKEEGENEKKEEEESEKKGEDEEKEEEENEQKEEGENEKKEEESERKKGEGEMKNQKEEVNYKNKVEILPFGNSGLSSSFKNPFVSLAANTENSNFLFSGFSGATKNNGKGVGMFGATGGDVIVTVGGEKEEEENNEETNEEPELESKAFTGEEQEETVYQCKNVDLFMLKVSENEEKSFKKLATGIIHLNIPKDQGLSDLPEVSDKNKEEQVEDTSENQANVESIDQVSKTITQPRIIFRQKGIYKVLLNSPLNPEISKTFQRNSNIRKGYAVNFIAIGPESEIQQCMLRFQNESDLIEFTNKVHQIVHQHYSKPE
ncbi:RAN binding domain [Cryptosporidium sp. chipmunk genotype I]|uniref:RAN binding domain n=1 Tax=Cryptosporidium sp. chipmunk genotype I TaxID=1280935 RepID=UPI00351A96D0|nr:RAN binding domain [Cryptosporidium sp. chipmunk genotype I]